jgi:septum site-determining protein MinD
MVNGHKKIFAEKSGRVSLTPVTFTSNLHLRNVIERIVTPLGRRIDEKTPYVDARLKDGSRVNAIIEPLAIDGPSLTIRKFKKGGISAEKYIEFGSITKPMIDFLKICVENGLNVVISGGTGSGKTSLLNMLSGFIPAHERIVTVEDAAELQMQQDHVVRLESRPANMEGTGAVTIRDLVRNALRMRIARLETLCLMAGMDLPIRAIREQVASAVNLIIQISRLSDGSRKVTSVTEVCGMQGDTVTLQEVFRFKETGFDKNRKILGSFQAMGLIPTFIEKLEAKGVYISRDLFSNDPNLMSTPTAKPATKTALDPMAAFRKTGTGGKT